MHSFSMKCIIMISYCLYSDFCNVNYTKGIAKVWEIQSSFVCIFFLSNRSAVLLQSHKILLTLFISEKFSLGISSGTEMRHGRLRQGRMFSFTIVSFPHNDDNNNNLSHLPKSNLTVFMSDWRLILIKSCSCTGMFFNSCRDHLKFQFSI